MYNFSPDEEDQLGLLGSPEQLTPAPQAPQQPPPMNPQVQDMVMQKFNLGPYTQENRDKLAKDNEVGFGDKAQAALASIGAGFLGRDPASAGMGVLDRAKQGAKAKLDAFDQGRQAKVQDYTLNQQVTKDQHENDKFDPDSDTSLSARKMIEANFPQIAKSYGENWANVTAGDMDTIFKPLQLREQIEGRKESVRLANMSREDARKERSQTKMDSDTQKDAQALEKTLSQGWSARGGQAGVIQGKVNAAEAAEALLDQAKTQAGGLDSRQIEELAQSTARLLGGGQQASGRVEALVPRTWLGRAQSMKEYLSNNPQGQDMQAFTDRMADTIKREKALAKNQMQQYQVQSLASHDRLRRNNPDLYNQILDSHGLNQDVVQRISKGGAPAEDPTTSGKVKMLDPKGRTKLVDKSQVDAAIAAGGRVVDGPMVGGQ